MVMTWLVNSKEKDISSNYMCYPSPIDYQSTTGYSFLRIAMPIYENKSLKHICTFHLPFSVAFRNVRMCFSIGKKRNRVYGQPYMNYDGTYRFVLVLLLGRYFSCGINGMFDGSAIVFFSYIACDSVTNTTKEYHTAMHVAGMKKFSRNQLSKFHKYGLMSRCYDLVRQKVSPIPFGEKAVRLTFDVVSSRIWSRSYQWLDKIERKLWKSAVVLLWL
ncbi:hypothetical protein L484_012045 [Morus notabilis]|uniref:Uncharacterized protein n=1 Tax=Morus notabilis TaxID=981085 RepID=W9QS03_9ROSA|nr:hypothetical protein L484_012045 [Morus notabilis]